MTVDRPVNERASSRAARRASSRVSNALEKSACVSMAGTSAVAREQRRIEVFLAELVRLDEELEGEVGALDHAHRLVVWREDAEPRDDRRVLLSVIDRSELLEEVFRGLRRVDAREVRDANEALAELRPRLEILGVVSEQLEELPAVPALAADLAIERDVPELLIE